MITLIATVLNEGDNINRLMESILRQTLQPDEIVIVDGGSTDNTIAIMQSYTDRLPLTIIIEPGCNISRGRNIAIENAQGDVIAVTDAGVKFGNDWLEKITQPFRENPDVAVVAGFFQTDSYTLFEIAMGATVLPLKHEIEPETFLPSSRSVAFKKANAMAINGYPEWLDYCEDLIFDLRLKQTSPPFVFVPEALVHFQPRSSLRAFYKQYYLYARGDGKADLWRKRHIIRYVTYLVAIPTILLLSLIVHPLFLGLFLIGGIAYLYAPYKRLPTVMKQSHNQSIGAWLYIILLIPIIRIVGDIAKMIGYPIGWWWRKQHNPPDWRIRSKTLKTRL